MRTGSRRGLLRGTAALAAWCSLPLLYHAAHAQQTALPKIGILWGGSMTDEMMKAFRLGLRDLGYAEGRDLLIERKFANGNYALLPQLAAELARSNVRAIVVDGTPATQAAKHATTTIPIIMVMVSDPVGAGLVSNLAHPDGNITGLSLMTTDLSAKRLQLLKEAVPGLTRIAVLWNPDTTFHQKVIEEFRAAAPSLSIELEFLRVRAPEDFKQAVAAAQRNHAQVLYVIDDGFFFANRTTLLALASKARLPLVYAAREMIKHGALMFYGADIADLTRRSAGYVDKILKGTNPDALPIEQPMRFELVINLRMAEHLGIRIPQSVLMTADEVIR